MTKKEKLLYDKIVEDLKRIGVEMNVQVSLIAIYRINNFIMRGNRTIGRKIESRISAFNNAQEKWIGKKVYSYSITNRPGVVRYIFPKTYAEVMDQKEMNVNYPHPFKALIDWDDKSYQPSVISCGNLTII